MSPLGSITPLPAGSLPHLDGPRARISAPVEMPAGVEGPAFAGLLDHLVGVVDTKQKTAAAVTREVLLGDSTQLHQSVIAMQEAGVAFAMMVEVRNKLVESYQELMRMQV